jgi:hypothetical protein
MDLAVDASGNVAVTGFVTDAATGRDWTTIKYNPAGTRLWLKRQAAPGNVSDEATEVAFDAGGNVIVAGMSTSGSQDFQVVKYNAAGAVQWNKRYDASGNDDWVADMEVDPDGNVAVTGPSESATFSLDYATLKYSPTGVPLWVRRLGSSAEDDVPTALTFGENGCVAVTGWSGPITYRWMWNAKYDSAGTKIWADRHAVHIQNENGRDEGRDISYDWERDWYVVTGFANWRNRPDFDLRTLKYKPNGWIGEIPTRLSVIGPDDIGTANDIMSGRGNYVVGYISEAATGKDIMSGLH